MLFLKKKLNVVKTECTTKKLLHPQVLRLNPRFYFPVKNTVVVK